MKTVSERNLQCVENWLFGAALPLWRSVGIASNGLAIEELDFSGKPKDAGYHRTMVQFRQVFCFAKVSLAGRMEAEVATALFHRVAKCAWHPNGGWVHKLGSNGDVLDDTRDACDQSFALLAAAWAFKASGDDAILGVAHKTLDFLNRHMIAPNGGFDEAVSVHGPRRQNTHMHLCEAFLALYEASGDKRFLSRADKTVALLEAHFADKDGVLREYFDASWTPLPDGGNRIEPGHHFEWVWLLSEYERLSGVSTRGLSDKLFERGMRGCDESGLAIATMNAEGRARDGSKMLWAQTEMLKAFLVHEGDTRTVDTLLDTIFTRFLATTPNGIWHEKLDSDGAPSHTRMPASTFYHLIGAFTELLRAGRA